MDISIRTWEPIDRMLYSTPSGSWEIVPVNMLAGAPLVAILLYLGLRAIILIIAIAEIYAGVPMKSVMFPKRSKWSPDKTRLANAKLHCIAAGALLAVYLYLGAYLGWLEFVEH